MHLTLAHITKTFGAHRVLDDVSLSFENAHSVVFIGPSGGGKSTLLRIIAGLETPDAGTLSVNGEPVHFENERALREHRRRIGVVFQAFNLFPHLSALENITLPLEKVHGLAPDAARDTALESLRRFRLETHAHKKPAELSGGQKQRVAIARAVAIKPRLLLFDEPTSALDPEMTAEVLDVIEELKEEGRDLILVTHEMGFARIAANQVVFLADGKIVETGAPAQLFEQTPRAESCRRFLAKVLKY
jgi:polar amino acid transport system ATP-binding protein